MQKQNDIKFYVSEEVLEILFDFLKKDQNIKNLEAHIENMTLKAGEKINDNDDKHPAEYFEQIKTKIYQIKKFINEDFKELSQEEQKALAEFLYSLEDLASDQPVYPEKGKRGDCQPKMPDPLLKLLLIRVLALPVIEQCQYRYSFESLKAANINLVQDFNFLEKCTEYLMVPQIEDDSSNSYLFEEMNPISRLNKNQVPRTGKQTEYGFLNFYPFNKFTDEQDAINFHYKIMAKNYFSYLKDVIDNNPDKFFVCYKPGVSQFGNHTETIKKIFKSEYDKLEDKYKDRMLFCVNRQPINGMQDNGFKYDYTVEELKRQYSNNKFLSQTKDKDIIYVNGVARDPWAKIGNEGRWKAKCGECGDMNVEERISTDSRFIQFSNETEKLYGVEISDGKQQDGKTPLKNLNAKPADIHIIKTQIIQKSEPTFPNKRTVKYKSTDGQTSSKEEYSPIIIGQNRRNKKLNALYKRKPLFTSDGKVMTYNMNTKTLTIQLAKDYYKQVEEQQKQEREKHNIDLRDIPNNKKLQTTTHTNKNNIKI